MSSPKDDTGSIPYDRYKSLVCVGTIKRIDELYWRVSVAETAIKLIIFGLAATTTILHAVDASLIGVVMGSMSMFFIAAEKYLNFTGQASDLASMRATCAAYHLTKTPMPVAVFKGIMDQRSQTYFEQPLLTGCGTNDVSELQQL